MIDRFDVEIKLQADATIYVKERIDVTFNLPRRGIYRTIPIVYDIGGGEQRAIRLDLVRVHDGTNDHTILTSREGNDLKIRIGDADVTLSPGTKRTYVIEYSVFGALNWHEDATWSKWTELYWNVTGHEWDAPIREAHFRVGFPEVGDGDVRARVFTGGFGSKDQVGLAEPGETDANNPAETAIALSTSDFEGVRVTGLNAYEGLTLVLAVPAETVPKPSALVEFLNRVREQFALLTIFIVAPFMGFLWLKNGRDMKDPKRMVRFEPPDDLPACETGTLIDEKVDQRDIAAGIMSLCVQGYLEVEVVTEKSLFKKREYALIVQDKKNTSSLSPFEEKLLDRIKIAGDFVTSDAMRMYVAPAIADLKNSVYEDLVKRGYYQSNPNMVRAGYIALGLILSAAVAFLLMHASLIAQTWTAVVGALAAMVPSTIFGYHMPKRTYPGTLARRQALGFYEMMRHRENYMAWVEDKHPDGLKYEEYLPYAVAFDLIDQWSDAFKDIVTEPPHWYHDPYGGAFSAHLFAHNMRAMATDFGTAAVTQPRSEGASGGGSGFSSGGGFSGGGFGGGGGGSW